MLKLVKFALPIIAVMGITAPTQAAWLLQGTGQPSGTNYYACKCKDGTIAINWTAHAFTQEQCQLACGSHGIVVDNATPARNPIRGPISNILPHEPQAAPLSR